MSNHECPAGRDTTQPGADHSLAPVAMYVCAFTLMYVLCAAAAALSRQPVPSMPSPTATCPELAMAAT